MRLVNRIAILKTADLLAGVPDDILAQVGSDMEKIEAKAGTTVFRQGDRRDAVYLVVDGALSIERGDIQLVSLGRGECVGEFALIDGGPRSASAIAETDVLMLKWMREDFDTTISKNRAVVYGLFKILTDRLRRENHIRIEIVLEQERWQQDLKRAHEIQMGMLPEGDLITDHIEISGNCRPAADVGGDYYDYLLLEDDAPSHPPLVHTVSTRPPVRRRGFGSEILSTVAVRGQNAVTSPTSIRSPTGSCPT